MNSADLLLHPVRLRVVKTFLGDRSLTTTQIAAELDDIPKGSLYRHIAMLTKAGILQVVAERPVRGAVEKTYTLRMLDAQVPDNEVEAMSRDDQAQAFMTYIAGQVRTPLFGVRTRERWDDESPALDRLEEALTDHIALELGRRWRDLEALKRVLAGLAVEYGCPVVHRELRQAIVELRAKLRDLHARLGGALELPGPTEDEVELLRGLVLSEEGA